MNGTGTTLSDITSNPLWQFLEPIFSVLAVIILAAMIWRISRHYFKGDHSNILVAVVFGMISVLFLVDPTMFFFIITWFVQKIGGLTR
ncbi:TcpD family membrane protein [Alicyclobacillus fructus]|uniref:TcpD family membrane protein n=1 Tax=Alicyclobacillus fructus TaxID=2816082 RepID=UPI001A909503|nr:TcpD family membrane protein [Alicyclobacillus fructus]